MKSFRRCISDILLMTGWTLTVFSIARMSTFAAILMKWKERSNQYYTQEVPNIINKNSFDWSEETRDAVWFSQASEKIVMHDVIRSVAGSPLFVQRHGLAGIAVGNIGHIGNAGNGVAFDGHDALDEVGLGGDAEDFGGAVGIMADDDIASVRALQLHVERGAG